MRISLVLNPLSLIDLCLAGFQRSCKISWRSMDQLLKKWRYFKTPSQPLSKNSTTRETQIGVSSQVPVCYLAMPALVTEVSTVLPPTEPCSSWPRE
jgi:hypothetical protein